MTLPAFLGQLQLRSCSLAWSASGGSCCRAIASHRAFVSTPQHCQQQPPAGARQAKPEHLQGTAAQPQQTAAAITSRSSRLGEMDTGGYQLVYEGFFSRPHTRLKYASLLNTFASFAAAPLIIQYSTASPIARVAATTSIIAFAIITTGGLHWFTKPYIHQLWYSKEQQCLKAQTMSLFGGTRWKQFPLSSAAEFNGIHPLANFKVDNRTFYVDRGNFSDISLLQRLMPWAASSADQTKNSQITSDTPDTIEQHEVK